MAMAVDNTNVGFYGYDAYGERGYKLTWETEVSGSGRYSGFAATGNGTVSMVATKN